MSIGDRCYRFNQTIVRKPADSAVQGLRAVDVGAPDIDLFREHHAEYIEALGHSGVAVETLPKLEQFPDSVFVEDAALCLPKVAILMRPGAPTRLKESDAIRPAIEKFYKAVIPADADPEGYIEGGDIKITGREVLVGLSGRTNQQGYQNLKTILDEYGYASRMVKTPPQILHFKTASGLIDEDTILSTRELADSGCFEGYRLLFLPDGEEPAANAIRVNDKVFVAAGYPKTVDMLTDAGYSVEILPNGEAAKLDGGLSCMSLRFST